MPLDQDTLQRLAAYARGELSARKLQNLRDRIDRDRTFAQEVADWEAVHRIGLGPDLTSSSKRRDLKQFLSAVEEREPYVSAKRINLSRRRMASIAAMLIGLISIILYFKVAKFNPQSKAEILAQQYTEWLPRQIDLAPGDEMPDALGAYDRKEYPLALKELPEAVYAGTIDSSVLLYAGVAALHLGKYQEAADLFATLNNYFTDPAREEERLFYWSLALIKNERATEAIPLLRRITTDPDAYYREKAVNLLQEITQK